MRSNSFVGWAASAHRSVSITNRVGTGHSPYACLRQHRRHRWIFALISAFWLTLSSVVASAPSMRLETTSEAGDFVGGGRPRVYTEADGRLYTPNTGRSTPGRVDFAEFYLEPGPPEFNRWFLLMVSTRELGIALQPGTYLNAERASFANSGRPGLDVTQDGAGCNTIAGSFVISEVRLSPSNEILFLDMTFEQRCDNSPGLLRGRFAYDASGAPISFASAPTAVPTMNSLSLFLLTLWMLGLAACRVNFQRTS
jgi:hypothetical protein